MSEARLTWARGLKAEYDDSIRGLMETYGLQAEEDLIVGAAGTDSAGKELDGAELGEGDLGRKQAAGSRKGTAQSRKEATQRQERAGAAFEALLAHFRERVNAGPPVNARESEESSKKPRLDEMHLNAAACFQVTYGRAGAESSGGTASGKGSGTVHRTAEAERAEPERNGGRDGAGGLKSFWELVARPRVDPENE